MNWCNELNTLKKEIFLIYFFSFLLKSPFFSPLLLVKGNILCICVHKILPPSSALPTLQTPVWAHTLTQGLEMQKRNLNTSTAEISTHCPTSPIAQRQKLFTLQWATMIHFFPPSCTEYPSTHVWVKGIVSYRAKEARSLSPAYLSSFLAEAQVSINLVLLSSIHSAM